MPPNLLSTRYYLCSIYREGVYDNSRLYRANKGRRPAKRSVKPRRANCGKACKSWKKVR